MNTRPLSPVEISLLGLIALMMVIGVAIGIQSPMPAAPTLTPTPSLRYPSPTLTPSLSPTPITMANPVVPADWREFDLDGFVLYAPNSCSHEDTQGIDSNIGQIVCSDYSLTYDYGWYSNPLSEYDRSREYIIDYRTLDEKVAKFVRPVEAPGWIGVYVSEVEDSDLEKPSNKLTIGGDVQNSTSLNEVLTILENIRFTR